MAQIPAALAGGRSPTMSEPKPLPNTEEVDAAWKEAAEQNEKMDRAQAERADRINQLEAMGFGAAARKLRKG